jgi:hypothetical protein
VLGDLRIFARYVRRLPAFLGQKLTPEEAPRRIERQLERRQDAFLWMLERGVYGNPRSPYRRLLQAAGVELGDAMSMVREAGLEQTLGSLREAGVYVTLDEFKGRQPLERLGVSLPVGHRDFDNPLLAVHYRSATGGSRGVRRRVSVDLDLLEHEAAYHSLFRTMFRLWDRPFAVWRAIPPSASGINNCLRQVKLGAPVARWFTPWKPPLDLESLKFSMFTRYTVRAGRRSGARLRRPEYCPPEEAHRIAGWLADRKREGRPAVLDTQTALGVRVCLAAKEQGLDISGTFFRFGGEPYTEGKAKVIEESGSTAVCHYTMAETGRIGVACGTPTELDEVHLLTDKLAVLQREKVVGATGVKVGALHYTTLLPSSSKLMINVESDDYGVIEERPCGCPFGELGLTLHLHGIRSYEKLTSEGNHFLGSDLLALVDEVLPARFGGTPTDYQLVEEEVNGLPKVGIVIRPHLGEILEEDVVSAVLTFLGSQRRNRLMAEVWRDGQTLGVVRREPYMTAAAKILPLHMAR